MSTRRPRSEWQQILAEWRASDLSAAEFAEARGVSARSLRWWSWRLPAKAARLSRPRPRAAKRDRAKASVTFLELPGEPTRAEFLELVLRDGRVLRFPASVEARALASVLSAIEARR